MNTFTLSKLQGSKDSLSGRLTFAQTKEAKAGAVIYGVFYLLAILADEFGMEWFAIPGITIAIFGLILFYIPLSFNKNAGSVMLSGSHMQIDTKKEDDDFPESPIDLEKVSKIEINTVRKIRIFSSFVILQIVIYKGENKSSFGITINNRKQERQYLEILDSWYRKGFPVFEYDELGIRVFKLIHGKNYDDIQQIKKEYGINW